MTLQEHTSKKDGPNSVQCTGTIHRSVEPLPVAAQSSSSTALSILRDVATDRSDVPQRAPLQESGGEGDPAGSFRGQKRGMTSEERRLRKNALARARALRLRNNLEAIKQKPVVSTEERERLGRLEEQRQKKNARSKMHMRERKREIERILATPESLRSDRQRQTLVDELRAKQKKNNGDRLRRERIRRERGQVPREDRPPAPRPMPRPTVGPAPRPPPTIPPFVPPPATPVGPAQMLLPTIPPFGTILLDTRRPQSPSDVGAKSTLSNTDTSTNKTTA